MASISLIEQMRKVEWSRSYLWSIKFKDAPSPFNDWFPASECTENSISGSVFATNFYLRDYKFPQTHGITDISITTYDDIHDTLYNWFEKWNSEIYDDSNGVMTLQDASKQLEVNRLGLDQSITKTTVYWVFPDGSVPRVSNSQSDTRSYTISLIVAG